MVQRNWWEGEMAATPSFQRPSPPLPSPRPGRWFVVIALRVMVFSAVSARAPGLPTPYRCPNARCRHVPDRPDGVKSVMAYVRRPGAVEAEVAASSASYDLHDKLDAYQRNGVREYIVWRVFDRQVDWFVLRGQEYARLSPGDDGILRSTVFAGLWLDSAALANGDFAKLLDVLEQGMSSAEHAEFMTHLQRDGGQPAS